MFNLPINSKISGCNILHEGNHNEKDSPHEQYINKWNLNTTINNATNINKYTKILEIVYEEDNNMGCNYIIEIVNTKDLSKTNYLYMTLGVNKTLKYEHNDTYALWYKITSLEPNGAKVRNRIEVFIQLYKSYSPLFYRIHTAKNNEVWNYDKNYAYSCITLLSNQPLLDSIDSIIQCSDTLPIRQFYHRQSWGEVSIESGAKYQIVITNNNIKWDSVLNFTTSAEVPSELMYTVSILSVGKAVINIRNISNTTAKFPSCQLLLLITQSF